MGFIVWQGDKLTKDDKLRLQKENNELYGITLAEVKAIKLPNASNVQIFDI